MNDDDDREEDEEEEEEESEEEEEEEDEDDEAEARAALRGRVAAGDGGRGGAAAPGTGPARLDHEGRAVIDETAIGCCGRSAARAFAQDYRKLCERLECPPVAFYADSYRQRQAFFGAASQSKLLLIYLHSPFHQDAEDFCRGLTSAQFQGFCRQRFVLWGASVNSADGHALSDSLGATRFPFLAIVICDESWREGRGAIHGAPSDGDALVATLDGALTQQRGVLQACDASSARGRKLGD